ncbi:hypothetical protein ACFWG0_27150 [Streptomyces yangpuensis]|uniref:hypothetical protein n=1 Tax=Streptomyces yangpuensis TaxID=1648182 RepID=UPI00365CA36C
MRFVITDDNGTVLATAEPPSEGATSINIEREDRPDLLFASADLYGSDGSVHLGHWPGGVEWETLLHTTGVPNPYGSGRRAAPAERVSAQEIANLIADFDLDDDALDVAVHEAFAEHKRAEQPGRHRPGRVPGQQVPRSARPALRPDGLTTSARGCRRTPLRPSSALGSSRKGAAAQAVTGSFRFPLQRQRCRG